MENAFQEVTHGIFIWALFDPLTFPMLFLPFDAPRDGSRDSQAEIYVMVLSHRLSVPDRTFLMHMQIAADECLLCQWLLVVPRY